MKQLRKYKKLLALALVIVLLTPFLVILATPIVYSSTDNIEKAPWLKGILLFILSFIINNFVEKNNSNSIGDPIIDHEPLIDPVPPAGDKEVLGFHVNWLTPDADSYQSLKENWNYIDMIAPYWYTVNPDGSLENSYGGHQYEVDSFAVNRGIEVLPLITNNQQNNMILVDPAIRTKAINNIVDLIVKYNYAGVNIDFEYIPPWTRNGYTAFIKELSGKLKREDKLVTVSVFPKIEVPLDLQGAYDYAALSNYVDKLVMMTYDKHWASGSPGPIAPLRWVEENIKYALEYIPAEQLLLGIANYGYDWPENGRGKDISAKKALQLAQEKGVEVKWHDTFQTPYYYYWDSEGIKHEVWFESSNSLAFKLELVNKYNLSGVAVWRLGNETDKFWEMIKEKLR